MKILTTIFLLISFSSVKAQLEVEYYKNGQIKSSFEYRNDTVMNVQHYWSNGNLQKTYDCTYNIDETIIQSKQYTKKGVLINSERKVNDLKDGTNQIFYKNGNIRIEGIDSKGVRIKETYYDSDGKVTKEISCDPQTSQCLTIEYDKNSQVKKEYQSTFKGYGTVMYK